MTTRKQLPLLYSMICKQTNTTPLPRKILFTGRYLIMEINNILTKNNCIPLSINEIEDMLK